MANLPSIPSADISFHTISPPAIGVANRKLVAALSVQTQIGAGPRGHPAAEINPDHLHTPGIFVTRIVEVGTGNKRIEFRNTRKRPGASAAATGVEV